MQGRTIAARVVAIVAAALIVLTAASWYVRHELLDAQRFSDRATAALRDRDVRDLVAREVTDRVILRAEPDLLAARPLIQSITGSLAESGPFLALYGSGVRRLHASLLSGHSSQLELDLGDTGTLVASTLQRLQPRLAGRIEAQDVTLRSTEGVIVDAAHVARTLRRLAWILLGLSIAAVAVTLALAPVRRDALRLMGIAAAVAAVAGRIGLDLARTAVTHAVGGDASARGAANATFTALLGDLGDLLLLVAAAGAITAAVAAGRGNLPDLQPLVLRAWARVRARPVNEHLRLARAAVLLVLGVLVLLDPGGAVRVVAWLGGVLLVYIGVDQLLDVLQRRVGPPPAHAKASPGERGRRVLRRALPASLVLVLAGAGIAAFAGGGGIDPPASPSPTPRCNGHVELCGRRLDQVVMAATHNAMSVADEPGWFAALQEHSIPAQLAAGVHGLLIDAHYGIRVRGGVRTDLGERAELAGNADRELYLRTVGPSGLAAIGRIRDRAIPGDGTPGVYLCHRFCELGATELTGALTGIHDFMVLHPGEVIVIIIEDYVKPEDVVAAFRSSGLADLVYTGPPAGPFPTLRTMIDSGRRVVVYAENHGDGAPWYTVGYDAAIQETPFSFSSTAALTDPARLPASCAPNRGTPSAPLFLMNHWINTDPTPRISLARTVNGRAALVRRARACQSIRHQLPNLLAVDFYATGDVFGAVDELNGL